MVLYNLTLLMYIPSFHHLNSPSISSFFVSPHVVSVRVLPHPISKTQIVRFYVCPSVLFLCLPEKPVPVLCLCYMSVYLSIYILTHFTYLLYSPIHLFICFFGTERIDDGGLFGYQYYFGISLNASARNKKPERYLSLLRST